MRPSTLDIGKNVNRRITAKLIYISSKMASRFQSIRFCLIHIAILIISQITVKAICKNKNGISTINYTRINSFFINPHNLEFKSPKPQDKEYQCTNRQQRPNDISTSNLPVGRFCIFYITNPKSQTQSKQFISK